MKVLWMIIYPSFPCDVKITLLSFSLGGSHVSRNAFICDQDIRENGRKILETGFSSEILFKFAKVDKKY